MQESCSPGHQTGTGSGSGREGVKRLIHGGEGKEEEGQLRHCETSKTSEVIAGTDICYSIHTRSRVGTRVGTPVGIGIDQQARSELIQGRSTSATSRNSKSKSEEADLELLAPTEQGPSHHRKRKSPVLAQPEETRSHASTSMSTTSSSATRRTVTITNAVQSSSSPPVTEGTPTLSDPATNDDDNDTVNDTSPTHSNDSSNSSSSRNSRTPPGPSNDLLITWIYEEFWDVWINFLNFHKQNPNIIAQLRTIRNDHGDGILHMMCSHESLPLALIEQVFSLLENRFSVNPAGHTVLHQITIHIPTRNDIIRKVIAIDPSLPNTPDENFMRPMDYLSLRMIMNEERARYRQEEESISRALWTSAKVLALASMGMAEDALPVAHACLLAENVPFALKQRVIKKHRARLLLEKDVDGNLPLHMVTRRYADENGVGDNDDDDDVSDHHDFLFELIRKCPEAATKTNDAMQTPLDVAIDETTRGWSTGVLALLECHPGALQRRNLPMVMYPHLFARLAQERQHSTLFSILQSRPGVVYNHALR